MVEDRRMVTVYGIRTENLEQFINSTVYVVPGLKCPLAAKIDFIIDDRESVYNLYERCMLDKKCIVNTYRKPWSKYQMVTSLLVSNAR